MTKKIINVCINAFFCLLTIILLFLFVINSFGKNGKLVKIFNYSFLDVNGNSMYPEIRNGDLIVIDRDLKNNYKIKDIISYYMEVDGKRIIVTHEIVDINEHGFITKGINSSIEDYDIVTINEIIGEYKGIRIPCMGYVIRFANTSIGYLLLVVIPLGIILLIASYELIKEVVKKKEDF